MAQDPYLGKNVYLAFADSGSTLVEISGDDNGLRNVSFQDVVATPEKAGTGNYRERYSAERHTYTMSFGVQIGSTSYGMVIGKGGVLQDFELGPQGNVAGNPKWTFKAFMQSGNMPLDTDADAIDVDVDVMISGQITEATY